MASNVFDDKPIEGDQQEVVEVTFDDLVGDTQKYKTSDDLAKAYAHADALIAKQQEEKVRMEAELKVLKDIADARKEQQKSVDEQSQEKDPPADSRQNDDSKKRVDDDKDLTSLIREEMERADKEKTFSTNVNSVSEKLAAHFGSGLDAQKAIQAKAKELNVSTEWLMDIAGRSPTAFYNTVGLDSRSLATPSSHGDVNTQALKKNASKHNFKYFEEIRKTNPKMYYSPQFQKEVFKARSEQGEAFYN